MTTFGFRVQRGTDSGWAVSLPHQCQRWDIAGEGTDPNADPDPDSESGPWYTEPHATAVAELEAFIAEAQRALTALLAETEFDETEQY